jgi:hypothetical protein
MEGAAHRSSVEDMVMNISILESSPKKFKSSVNQAQVAAEIYAPTQV